MSEQRPSKPLLARLRNGAAACLKVMASQAGDIQEMFHQLAIVLRESADEIDRLQQDNARYENGRVVMSGEIERLRMAERLNVETVAKLQQERDQLQNGCAAFVDMQKELCRIIGADTETDSLAMHMRIHAALSPPPSALPRILRDILADLDHNANRIDEPVSSQIKARIAQYGASAPPNDDLYLLLVRRGYAQHEAHEIADMTARIECGLTPDPFAFAPLTGPGSRLQADLDSWDANGAPVETRECQHDLQRQDKTVRMHHQNGLVGWKCTVCDGVWMPAVSEEGSR